MPWPPRGVVEVEVAALATVAVTAQWLSAQEARRADRFATDALRDTWIASRCFLRSRLGARLGCPPGDVPLLVDPLGRPHLVPGALPAGADFNLTHTGDLVGLAVAGARVGVDAEPVPTGVDVLDVARSVATSQELDELAGAPSQERALRFTVMWTRKEAVLKAMGTGLRHDPRRLHVGSEATPRPPDGWHVRDLGPVNATGVPVLLAVASTHGIGLVSRTDLPRT